MVLLLVAGLAIHAGALFLGGPVLGSDSPRYPEPARAWLDGGPLLIGRSPAYVAFLALTFRVQPHTLWLSVVGQALLSGAIPALVYAAVRGSGGSGLAAWTAGALALCSYELVRWDRYILTDALFVAASALALVATILTLHTGRVALAAALGAAVCFAVFLRAPGLVLAGASLLAAVLWRRPSSWLAWAAVMPPLALYAVYVSSMPLGPLDWRTDAVVCESLRDGRVFWGSDNYRSTPLGELGGASTARGCVRRAVTEHPGRLVALTFRKLMVYWLPVYPHYSWRHNAANLILLGGPITLALLGLWHGPRHDAAWLVAVAWLVVFSLYHAFTWVEPDHRFLAPALPAAYLLGGRGIDWLAGRRAATARP